MSQSQWEVKQGFQLCPHCSGRTECDCASCSVVREEIDGHYKRTRYYKGICKVCEGKGQIPK